MKKALIVIGAIVVSLLGVFCWWFFLDKDQYSTAPPDETVKYVGISSEVLVPFTAADKNNVFWSSTTGEGGVAHSLNSVYFPSLHRLRGGFIAPDYHGLVIFDKRLQEVRRLPVQRGSTDTQTFAADSPGKLYAAYDFNNTSADVSESSLIAVASPQKVRTTTRPKSVSALTVCDDGTTKWLEYSSKSLRDGTVRTSKHQLAIWNKTGSVKTFALEPGIADKALYVSSLGCGGGVDVAIIGSVDDSRKDDAPSSDDPEMKLEALHLQPRGDKAVVAKRVPMGRVAQTQLNRFEAVEGDIYYRIDKKHILSAINVHTGRPLYRKEILTRDDKFDAVTYENGRAYLAFRAADQDNRHMVVPIDLHNPDCMGQATPLIGHDVLTKRAWLARGGTSFMVPTSILPQETNYPLKCA